MPRIRSLKPEHKQHRKIGPLTDRQYRLWVGMLTEADDDGRLVADPAQLRVLIWGYHPRVTVAHVTDALGDLAATGLIRLYRVGEVIHAAFPSWAEHQKIHARHYTPSKLPTPDDAAGECGTGTVSVPYLSGRIGSDRIGSGSDQERSAGTTAPALDAPSRDTHTPNSPQSKADRGAQTPNSSRSEASRGQPAMNGLPAHITSALSMAAVFGSTPQLRNAAWWQAEARANPGVNLAAELTKAEAWLASNPRRAPKRDCRRFLHSWFARAERPEVS